MFEQKPAFQRKTKPFKSFFNRIRPIYFHDVQKWEHIKSESLDVNYQVIWDASSGLDFYPVIATIHCPSKPKILIDSLQNPVLMMSDFNDGYLSSLMRVYDILQNGPVKVLSPSILSRSNDFTVYDFSCQLDKKAEGYVFKGEAFVEQMIPLTLWTKAEIDELRTYHKQNHSVGHFSAIADERWHVIYFTFSYMFDDRHFSLPVFYIAAENLTVYREIFERFQIPIELFFAVRVYGFSFSRDNIHDFRTGQLPKAIQSNVRLRPAFWGVDTQGEEGLPHAFKKILTLPWVGFGGGNIYLTNWTTPWSMNRPVR